MGVYSDNSSGSEYTTDNEYVDRLNNEATKAFKKWKVFYVKIDWKSECPNMDLPSERILPFEHLVYCDMGVFISKIMYHKKGY